MIAFFHAIDPLFVLSGFVVGMLVGLTGVGGGSLMTPLLILMFGIHPVTAVGTDLLYAAATKTVGTMFHSAVKSVDWRIVSRLAAGSLPVTVVVLLVLWKMTHAGAAAGDLIKVVLGIALLLSSAALIFRKPIMTYYVPRMSAVSSASTARFTIAVGAAIGLLVSISSVGAGAIGVMLLVLLYPQMPMARIVGSDIAHAVPLTLVAGIGHWWLGSTNWMLLATLLIGSIPGICVGSYFCSRLPDGALRLILAATLIVVAVRLLV